MVKILSKNRPQPTGSSGDTLFKLLMKYDGAGRRISKTSMRKSVNSDVWDTAQVTHYTGIGTEVRENYAGSTKDTKVVVNMPQGLGRYGIEDAERPNYDGVSGDSLAGYIPNAKFEWYLKNHLGSTMLVYGTQADANPQHVFVGTPLAAYDYRAFGEMVEMLPPAQKVTENFTGKEHDDEIALDYFGARYLDPILGMWISVDPKRQFSSPYLYVGNGFNPIVAKDDDGNRAYVEIIGTTINVTIPVIFTYNKKPCPQHLKNAVISSMEKHLSGKIGEYKLNTKVVIGNFKGMMANEISIESGDSRAHANRIYGTATLYKDIGEKNFEYTSAHEGAHLIGLDDKYIKGSNIPLPNYEKNLMGKWGEYDLKPEQVEEIFNHPENDVYEKE